MADMHARPLVDRAPVFDRNESPDSASRVPEIGDIDMITVNRLLYEVSARSCAFLSLNGACTAHLAHCSNSCIPWHQVLKPVSPSVCTILNSKEY